MDDIVGPLAPAEERPLLAFAMTQREWKLLNQCFPTFRSVSLYGHYGQDHTEGVDVRDLGRYDPESMAGVFGSLLFDYFVEHDVALTEAFRVTQHGGLFFTHIAPYRLKNGMEPPQITGNIQTRPDYFGYVPSEEDLPTITVGRAWFIRALEDAGFNATHVRIVDGSTDHCLEWFVGVKPGATNHRSRPIVYSRPSDSTQSLSRLCSIPVDPAHGFKRVLIELSVPALPEKARSAAFAEHVMGPGGATATVIAPRQDGGGLAISEDLGHSWEVLDLPDTHGIALSNCFTTTDGVHLLQAPGHERRERAPLFAFGQDWELIDAGHPTRTSWHGTRSIDQSGTTIIYGEYPANSGRLAPDFNWDDPTPEQRKHLRDSQLVRSPDGGLTWELVLEVDWRTVRHFHTVVSDPYHRGRWWASSGDAPTECRVWQSLDDGVTWQEISDAPVDVELHPRYQHRARSVFRYTDLIVRRNDVIWGSDDQLGAKYMADDPDVPLRQRAGARIFRSSKDPPWRPQDVAYVGNPVRSLIDVGPGYIVTTEAKGAVGYCPQVLLLSKKEPLHLTPLLTIDNFAPRDTGFTYSRASREAKNGVFFSYRNRTDAFPEGPQILRWRIEFD